MVYMCYIFIIHSSAEGNFDWFHFQTIMNRAAMSIAE